MISPELLRRYPFFAGLNHDQLVTLAKVAMDLQVDAGHSFFLEGDELDHFYLVLEGAVSIVIGLTDRTIENSLYDQLNGTVRTKDIPISHIGEGDFFGWSALIPPHRSTAGAKAIKPSRVVAFDCTQLQEAFQKDRVFGYLMTQKVAQLIRQRLRDLRIELLASFVEHV